METFLWRSQYYLNVSLVEDNLEFDGATFKFAQNISAFPYQTCLPNYVIWSGGYESTRDDLLTMSYTRCTPSGLGCVSCTPTSIEQVAVSFASNRERMVLSYPGEPDRTYFRSDNRDLDEATTLT